MFKPNHWGQLIKGGQAITSNGGNNSRRNFFTGKIKSPARTKRDRDRADFCRVFISQLLLALDESANELQYLWERNALSKEVADLTRGLVSITRQTLYDSFRSVSRGAPKRLSNAKELLKEMHIFRLKIDLVLTHERPHALELACCIQEFCCDISHYEQQIRFVYGIVSVTAEGRPKLANRPTKWTAKNAFAKIVIQHQAIHGEGTFPKPRQIKADLSLANHVVPERTLREWRRQVQLGTFSRHTQAPKRQ